MLSLYVQEEEQAALDDEAERRRKRVQAWQEQRTKAQVLEEAAAQEAAQKAKGWSLEDDLDEVSPCDHDTLLVMRFMLSPLCVCCVWEGWLVTDIALEARVLKAAVVGVQEDTAAGGVGRTDDMEEDEVDPLDAFMNENAAKTSAPKPPVREPVQEEELDPLDAFMAHNTVASSPAPKQEDAKPKQEEPDEDIDPLDAFMATEIIPVANGPSKPDPSSQVLPQCLLHSCDNKCSQCHFMSWSLQTSHPICWLHQPFASWQHSVHRA